MKGYYLDIELGKEYDITLRLSSGFLLCTQDVVFIRTTLKGFNFLNKATSKCVFSRGLYKSKKKDKFFLSKKVTLKIKL